MRVCVLQSLFIQLSIIDDEILQLAILAESKELVAWMKGHASAIHTISLHASGRYALTSSVDTGQLWDLDTFQRKRKLNVKENVGIIKVGRRLPSYSSALSNIYKVNYKTSLKNNLVVGYLTTCLQKLLYGIGKK